jgi:tripartite-type tricarboxylate transporter receptor subunit TctC
MAHQAAAFGGRVFRRGPTDVIARGFAVHAGKGLGQPVVVDGKPGANTIIAPEAVANATDGHTLLMAATNHTMIPALYHSRVKFDAIKSSTRVVAIWARCTRPLRMSCDRVTSSRCIVL